MNVLGDASKVVNAVLPHSSETTKQQKVEQMKQLARIFAEIHAKNLSRGATDVSLDETAAGKLAANMVGGFNQYFSDTLSERMRDRTRQSVLAGRFPWRAPIGYANIGGKQGAKIKPDPIRAPLIQRAFSLISDGHYKKSDVLKIVSEEGLRTVSGKPLSAQTFQDVLRNPLYAGWVTLPSDPSLEPVRGLHQPIVDQELFDRVQAILDGRKPTIVAKRKFNPLLPLKCFVRCEACGTPLTGGLAQGRTKKYPRYWCRKPGCRAVRLSSEKLEGEVLTLLGRLRPTPETIADFPKIAAKVWEERQGDSEKEMKRISKSLEEQTRLKSELLKMRM